MSTLRSRAALALIILVAALVVGTAGTSLARESRASATTAAVSCAKKKGASRTACLKLQQALRDCAKQKGAKRTRCKRRVRALAQCEKKHGAARARCQQQAITARRAAAR